MNKRPSFLVFCTDQQHADWLGCAGHPVLRTPHIDALAATGVRCTRHIATSPVCMPNRASLMTGRWPAAHGVRMNGVPLALHSNTFVEALRAGGWRTALIGKAHLQTMSGFTTPWMDRTQELDDPAAEARRFYTAGGRYDQEEIANWSAGGRRAVDLPYYGFEHVDLVTMHADHTGARHAEWLAQHLPEALPLRWPGHPGLPHRYTCPQAVRTAVPEAAYSTRYIQERAVEWLEGVDAAQPFFAFVSFPDPHHPFSPPGRYWDLYRPEDMPLPANLALGPDATPMLRWLREQPLPSGLSMQYIAPPEPRQLQEAMALTAGMLTMIDDAVGAVMDALRRRGLDDDTVVVFMADHGEALGDHGLLFKGPLHYQAVIRAPLIWRDPAMRRAAVCTGLVSTADIAPTVLARAGLPAYAGMQGRDAAPVLRGEAPGRAQVLVQEDHYAPLFGRAEPPRVRSLLTPQHRLSIFMGEPLGELYDLQADPLEQHNLWEHPEHQALKAALTEALVHEMAACADDSPRPLYLG